ncbi:MAG: hypothetical protein PHF86_11775 [Candidatus Nanoarchaeia archaeon]|jgi:hypothetical protein|nr:hypothetical protein [Candidatus Nanoarchaeia archaeon]
MAQDPMSKRPLMPGQFAWAISRKSGQTFVIFGPDPMDATDDEMFLLPSKNDPTKVEFIDSATMAIQNFVRLDTGEYAVIHNPTEQTTVEHPNGPYSKGRSSGIQALKQGSKRVVISGYFPVWPGQRIEVRQVHTLSSNQFLMAVVEGDVDEKAPYYGLTVACASIKQAIVNKKEEHKPETLEPKAENVEVKPADPVPEKIILKIGQRIIIPGNLTPTYIPPSGIEIIPEAGSMIRQAVVLGPTEFCVLLDEDGQPLVKKGPGRVFPGPYHVFRDKDSRARVYDAYHLRPDRGILLRVVVDSITKEELAKQLPAGSQLEKELYTKGDEIFIHGFDSYLIPSQSIEVIDPKTRMPHIGNNHSSIYVQAIGVDQKSGVYVANVETGNIDLVKGETKLLLDPRKHCHVKRKIPGKMWNLIIAKGEAHKRVPDDLSYMVETPWALSVIIPNNEAVLVTSKDGRRAEVGPKTILLGYEEWLEVLTLSRGKPKEDNMALETCFLRVSGNRISDRITLETEDFVSIQIDVKYGVEFEQKTEGDQVKWFNYQDYVKFFCQTIRSRLRAAAKKINLTEIYPKMTDFVRNTVLGEKPENGHRPGMVFEENSMRVVEVDVLVIRIPDMSIAQSFDETTRQIVLSELERAAQEVQLTVAKRLDEINEEKVALTLGELGRSQKISAMRTQISHDQQVTALENQKIQQQKRHDVERENTELALKIRQVEIDCERENAKKRTELDEQLKDNQAESSRKRKEADNTLEIQILKTREDLAGEIEGAAISRSLEFKEKLNTLELTLIAAGATADVERLKAVQPELIAAIEGLGDKQAIAELMHNMPAATGELGYILGSGGIAGILKMLEGTPFAESLKTLKAKTTPKLKKATE